MSSIEINSGYSSGVARKNPHAVALGKKGGRARARKLDPQRRAEIARQAGSKGGHERARKLTSSQQSRIGRKAGLVGGKARAAKLTKEQRSAVARKAAAARWAKTKKS